MKRSSRWSLTLCTLVTVAPTAFAQDAAQEARRRQLIEQATSASHAGDHRAALDLMNRAGTLRMTPGLRMVIAQEQQLLDRPLDAYDSASRCLQELDGAPGTEATAQVRTECTALVNALRGRVGTLRLVLAEPSPTGLQVWVANALIEPARWREPLRVAPGPVSVLASAPDGTLYRSTVTVPAGGEQSVTITYGPPTAAASVATTSPPPPPSPAPASGNVEATQLSLGGAGDCLRAAGGRVVCWWSTPWSLGSHPPAVVAGVERATAVSVGSHHACAIVAEGHVRCWGDNSYGQLGDGTHETRNAPVEARGVERAVSIAAGTAHTCAALESGQVMCWGEESSSSNASPGALGDGTQLGHGLPAPVVGMDSAVEVVAHAHYSCARLRDGTVSCWGANAYRTVSPESADRFTRPTPVRGIAGAVQISASQDYVCAVRDDGSVACWGADGLGRFGYEDAPRGTHVVAVPGITNATAVTAGNNHVCALRRNRTVACWGSNEYSRLGALRVREPFRPRTITGLGPVSAVSASISHTCVLQVNGAVRCWGLVGGARTGDQVTRAAPVTVPLASVR